MSILRAIIETGPTETPAFRKWFGKSKVTDGQGRPLKVFHGTSADVDSFKHRNTGAGARESGLGHWFTENTDAAHSFANFARGDADSNIIPAYLSIQNPWMPESYKEIMELIDRHTKFERPGYIMGGSNIRMINDKVDYAAARAELQSHGYDGVILANTMTDSPDGETPITQYIIFKSAQAKSIFNKGEFSDSDHLSEAITDNTAFKRWFGKSKVVDGAGNPLKVYHGSSADIKNFSHDFIGKGVDQYGSGFYFATDPSVASGYATGVENGANVTPVYLSIQKPLDADKRGKLTTAQVKAFILRSPILDDALSAWGDVGYEGYDRVLANAIKAYVEFYKDTLLKTLHPLANDFYGDEHAKEFVEACRDILGYDGVKADFDGSQFWVAWSPNQIKSVFNKGTYSDSEHLSEARLRDGRDIYPEPKGERWLPVGKPQMMKIADLDLHPAGLSIAHSAFMWADQVKGKKRSEVITSDKPVAVTAYDGQYHVLDGYHRIVKAHKAGAEDVLVQVMETHNHLNAARNLYMSESGPVIDNVNGLGSVPYNQDVGYRGMKVHMKPSKFLALAAAVSTDASPWLTDAIKSGQGIGAPFLVIEIPTGWWDGDYTNFAKVVGHEGRHRMKAVQGIYGDVAIETHLMFRSPEREVRARHLHANPDWMKHLKMGVRSERSRELVSDTFE